MEFLGNLWHLLLQKTEAAPPAILFLAIALFPLAGVPISPIWIAVGVRLGTLGGFFLAFGGACVNITLGYWLARRWLRIPLLRFVESRGWQVPEFSGADEKLAILSLRITPGIPLFVQNYLLGLAKVHFGRYLLLSAPIQAGYVLAFVWFGNSLASSRAWRVLLAAAGVAGLSMLVRLAQHWLGRRGPTGQTRPLRR